MNANTPKDFRATLTDITGTVRGVTYHATYEAARRSADGSPFSFAIDEKDNYTGEWTPAEVE